MIPDNTLFVAWRKNHWSVYRYAGARASYRSNSFEDTLTVARRMAAKYHLILFVQDCQTVLT